jgi:alpha-1,3-mannosyltransferase
MSERVILGVRLRVSSRAQEVEVLDSSLELGIRTNIAFANSHTLSLANRDRNYRHALQNFHVLNDGLGVDIASRIKFGQRFPENLNGTDFVPYYFSASRHSLRIFLLGACSDVAKTAADKLQDEYPQHKIVGHHSGYFEKGATDLICEDIRQSNADVVLVGMGNPLQELWILEYGASTRAKLLFGVGALFDFISGFTPRAPVWLRRIRCEWIFRLALEPKRLYRRYIIENSVFLKDIMFDRISEAESIPSVSSSSGPFG